MGLAASQARLLSITSRISDNELRAQLINNQKMRLSADSSKVSENYINALNKTNLVFANYGEDDKAQNVPLTFNNLTAFNQYNNQYGLTNTAGNILISERDAEYYRTSNSQDDFLKKYGIEYTTSYWDTLDNQLRTNESFYSSPDGDGVAEPADGDYAKYDSAGNIIANTTKDGNYNFFDAAQLREMYEGKNADGVETCTSYAETIKTQEYNDFASYVDSFAKQAAALKQAAAQKNQLMGDYAQAALSAGETFAFINGLSQLPDATKLTEINGKLKNDIGKYYDGATYNAATMTIPASIFDAFSASGSTGYIHNSITDHFGDNRTTKTYSTGYDESALYLKIVNPGASASPNYYARIEDPSGNGNIVFAQINSSGTSNLYKWNGTSMQQFTWTEDGTTYTPTTQVVLSGQTLQIKNNEFDENGNVTGTETLQYPTFNTSSFPTSGTSGNITNENITTVLPLSELLKIVKDILKTKAAEIFAEVGKGTSGAKIKESVFVSSYTFTDDAGATQTRTFSDEEKKILLSQTVTNSQVEDILKNICKLVFGQGQENKITNSDDMNDFLNAIMSGKLKGFMDGTQNIELKNTGTTITISKNDLASNKIRDCVNAYILDTMMDLFGEPIYGYMKKDSNGNWVTAKEEADWYINLYNKIKECGYQMLPKGLANSTEWIQFALENGIVTLEQINSEANWQPITYTSCSDIIEQNDKTAATVAEAEYNKAMRQIEAKDEMFDLELKNIDTEHSALESEYESVKKAMSGNIERTFQMYS